MHPISTGVLAGERLSLARAISQVENGTPLGQQILNDLFPFTGEAHIVGITGAPGTGKSSLVYRIALSVDTRTGIIAVDPTSPFSGGALLGDRVRMADLAKKKNVFIRSMASRGETGGLSQSTAGAAQVMDAAGYALILIETVGAGQAEIEIARLAHTVIVVEAPGMGDDIQANKAGILEIADILVVNKADLPGAENTARALKMMLDIGRQPVRGGMAEYHHQPISGSFQSEADSIPQHPSQGWKVPVVMTNAASGEGVDSLMAIVRHHWEFLHSSSIWQERERERIARGLERDVLRCLVEQWKQNLPAGLWESVINQVAQREISPSQALDTVLGFVKPAGKIDTPISD